MLSRIRTEWFTLVVGCVLTAFGWTLAILQSSGYQNAKLFFLASFFGATLLWIGVWCVVLPPERLYLPLGSNPEKPVHSRTKRTLVGHAVYVSAWLVGLANFAVPRYWLEAFRVQG